MSRKLVSEFLGTALLLIGVVGSGIMAQNMSPDNIGVALLANAIATGCMLYAIITVLGPVSGAHFNPAVTIAFFIRGELPITTAAAFVGIQIVGGIVGVFATHLMFDMSMIQTSTTIRTGAHLWWAEIVATFGLLFVIFGGVRFRPDAVPALVGLYITGAYWFTASTSFANPAVTIARSFTDTFAGIAPANVAMFIVAQIVSAIVATYVLGWLFREE